MLENYNEITIMLFLDCLVCCTALVPDVDAKHLMGYVLCFIFSQNFIVNLLFILVSTIRMVMRPRKKKINKTEIEENAINSRANSQVQAPSDEENRRPDKPIDDL